MNGADRIIEMLPGFRREAHPPFLDLFEIEAEQQRDRRRRYSIRLPVVPQVL